MSTCLIAGALAPNSLNTRATNSYFDSVQREFSQVVLNHLLTLNPTLTLHQVKLTSAVFIEGFNATLMDLDFKESVLIIEQYNNQNEFYLVKDTFVADKLELNYRYLFSAQSELSVETDTGDLCIKHCYCTTAQTHFRFDGDTTALCVTTSHNQSEEHNRLTASHTLSFSDKPGLTTPIHKQFMHYLSTMEGQHISHWDTLPLNNPANTIEQALFIARAKYNRLEGELELFELFMSTRSKLPKEEQKHYDRQLELVHHQVQNAFWSLEYSHCTDPSLQVLLAITLLEKFYKSPAQIGLLLKDIDTCWQFITNIKAHDLCCSE